MDRTKKITVYVSEELLLKAQKSTGQGITETIRRGLQLIAKGESYEDLRRLRGKMKFPIDPPSLKKDQS